MGSCEQLSGLQAIVNLFEGNKWSGHNFRMPDLLASVVKMAMVHLMSPHEIHLRSDNPDLLIEFDLPPGTHAKIGASPKSEITLPLTGIPPFSCTIGRFHDGRLYLADLDGAISRRVDLPDILSIPPYQFTLFQPEDPDLIAAQAVASSKGGVREVIASRIRSLFRGRGGSVSGQK